MNMVIIRGTGFSMKRKHTPICEIFDALNEMYKTGIIGGYLCAIDDDGNLIITIIERG